MKPTPHRLSGLFALLVLVACDGGAAPKDAPSKVAAKKAEPAKKTVEPAKVEPAKIEPAKVEPAKIEPAAVEPAKVEPAVVEPAVVEPAVVEPAAVEPAKVEPAVEPAVEPVEPAEPAVAAGDGSTPIALGPDAEILRLVLAKDVVDRKPVDPGTSFPSGTKVNLFIESRNEGETDLSLRVTWENVATGKRSPAVGVKIPVRKLNRTRAYRTLKIKGAHRCIVLGEGDKELAALPFTIE
jgi:hypothetical protein